MYEIINNPSQDTLSYNWYGASDVNLYNYNLCTRVELVKIKLPFDALQCDDIHCISHRNDIDQFYYNIINVFFLGGGGVLLFF